MLRGKLLLALALIASYGAGLIIASRLDPGTADQPMGASIDLIFGGFSAFFLLVIAVTKSWRFVGLVGRDQSPAIRWIVAIFVVLLIIQLLYFGAAWVGYNGAQGAVAIILVNIAFVAFNEEVLFRGFLWGATPHMTPTKRILFVTILFALFHLVNGFTGQSWGSTLFQVGIVGVSSIMDAVIRYGTGSLWPTIILHFLWDSSGLLGKGTIADVAGPVIQILITTIGLISLIVVARTYKHHKHSVSHA